ncbi:MAG: tRNA uridine-5-carboxymethylaminomethyl(34) synthesis GTPase MnmE [Alphaproteobacteria bacterium]|nr:tRNA uridine-5-carboxymethylaminomethyl(34) synthesis GTPase MnmE [Alphaproteobacteria bacterium]
MKQTIYALSTPPGTSGVAVIRVSGPDAFKGLQALTNKKDSFFVPRRTFLCRLFDPKDHSLIDRAMIIPFVAPHSFTGEDVVEYHIHGGLAVRKILLDVLSKLDGHRMAEAGEFSRRAFQNDKMDLIEAEGISDLIHAETEEQHKQALIQMDGTLSAIYIDWADRLKNMLAYMEADIDFAEDEDIEETAFSRMRDKLAALGGEIRMHLDDNRRGERLREGVQVVIVGAPNAGKSSLLNALARRDVAIVSQMAGTTRDIIEAHLDLNGYPVVLADTAGLRPEQLEDSQDGHDMVENEGIRRAIDRAKKADIKLLVFNGTELPDLNLNTLQLASEDDLFVVNKIDLYDGVVPQIADQNPICISVKEEEGLDRLIKRLSERIERIFGTRETPSLTRARHREALNDALESIDRALDIGLPELAAEDMRLAMRSIGRITGRVDVEDLLDVIFRDFCIGK